MAEHEQLRRTDVMSTAVTTALTHTTNARPAWKIQSFKKEIFLAKTITLSLRASLYGVPWLC